MALHESEDTVTKNGLTVLDARRKLERIIADRMNGSADDLDYTAAEIFYEETENEKHSMESSRVRAWIDEIYEDSKQVCWVGSNPNPFYFNEFMYRFKNLAYEFCIWTPVVLSYIRGHATTSYVE
ncbi:hypothetical protein PV326_014182, partial [Microctonus aethiopoides]